MLRLSLIPESKGHFRVVRVVVARIYQSPEICHQDLDITIQGSW